MILFMTHIVIMSTMVEVITANIPVLITSGDIKLTKLNLNQRDLDRTNLKTNFSRILRDEEQNYQSRSNQRKNTQLIGCFERMIETLKNDSWSFRQV